MQRVLGPGLRRGALAVSSTAAAATMFCASITAHAAQPGDQVIVRDLIASKGWTAVVPLHLNGDGLSDMLSYNAKTGRAVYSVAAQP